MKPVFVGLFLLISIPFCFGQQLSGSIKDDLGNPIVFASIIIKETDSTGSITDHALARNGSFSIQLKKPHMAIAIEVKAHTYTTGYRVLSPLKADSSYTVNFTLQKEKDLYLEEVVVSVERYPVQVKGDTVVYDIAKFRDSSSRKIEDVIKKLPGIEVDEESGTIRYKGKAIETVMIGGDNLFGQHYSIGTRNINVDIVEQIEAIENFSENPHLRDIENSDKVALNLKLKKDMLDLSGSVDAGLGLNNEQQENHLLNATLLGISARLKSFATFSANNIGVNNSPFKPGSLRSAQDKEQYANKLIPDSRSNQMLDETRGNFNQQLFGSYNGVMKLNSKGSLKAGLYYLKDRQTENFSHEMINIVEDEAIIYKNRLQSVARPTIYRAELNFNYHLTKSSLLEYELNSWKENNIREAAVERLNVADFQTLLSTKNNFLSQRLLYTKKMAGRKAFQSRFIHSMHQLPQDFLLQPSVLNPDSFAEDRQIMNVGKNYYDFTNTLLGAINKVKYTIDLSYNFTHTPQQTALSQTDAEQNSELFNSNQIAYKKSTIRQSGTLHIPFNKWKFTGSYSLSWLTQELMKELAEDYQSENNLFLEPSLAIQYTINEVSYLLARAGYKVRPLTEAHLFENPSLVGNQTLVSHTPDFSLQKDIRYEMSYLNVNMYEQLHLQASLQYNRKTGNFYDHIRLKDNLIILNYAYLARNTDEYSGTTSIRKYLPALSGTLEARSNMTISQYLNRLNDSGLRVNTNYHHSNELSLKTAFTMPVNFKNSFEFIHNTAFAEGYGRFSNQSLINKSKVMIEPAKHWLATISGDYHLPNAANRSQNFLFLDSELSYKPTGKKYQLTLAGKNLLNINAFSRIDTNDYSTTIYSTLVLPRYVMLACSYQL